VATTKARVVAFAELAAKLRSLPPRCGDVRLIAVDGYGAAGKSTFAGRLAAALDGAPVLHTDDFASWEDLVDWWPNVARVLEALAAGRSARFRAYDWALRKPGRLTSIAPSENVVLEGVSSGRTEFEPWLSAVVWIETPQVSRLSRGVARDGESMRDQWLAWMNAEDEFFARDRVADRTDFLVDGAPMVEHLAATEFVLVGGRLSRRLG
jgi:hypothetical protein